MKISTRVFAAFYLLVAVYLLLSFLYGRTGVVSTQELLVYRQKLYTNILELKKINNDLARKLQPLNTMENIKLKAREMGYIAENEKKIFLEGLEKPNAYHTLGAIIYRESSEKDNSQLIRSVSLIFSLLFFIISGILLTGRNGFQKNIRTHKHDFEMSQQ